MSGIYKLFVIGGAGGFMGADGVNPVEMIIGVGGADRMWLEPIVVRTRGRRTRVRVVIPARPHDPDLLLDAVLAFDLDRFAECPSQAAVREQLEGVTRLDFHLGRGIPAAWPALREEARPIFARMGIWQADLTEVGSTV